MPLLLLLLVPIAFGLNPVIARALVGEVEPGTLSLVRWGLATLLIGAIALVRGPRETWRIADRETAVLILLGALGFGFCSFAAYAGVRTTTATNVGLIYACTSALVMLIELVRGRIHMSVALAAGVVACVLGVVVILTQGDVTRVADLSFGAGELWALAGTFVWALYTAAMTGRATGMTPLAQFTLMSFAGALACLVPTVSEITSNGWPTFELATLYWIVALVLIPSCGAFIGYTASIKLNGGVMTSASLCLTPVGIAAMAIVLIGEDVRWFHGVAIALVVAGLGLINFDRSRAQRGTPTSAAPLPAPRWPEVGAVSPSPRRR
jgi:drug/metabolite transporter (DMT)-like permease